MNVCIAASPNTSNPQNSTMRQPRRRGKRSAPRIPIGIGTWANAGSSAWHVAGAPSSELRFGSFETWTQTIGGILEFIGVDGFLANRSEMLAKADDDGPQWHAFLLACRQEFGDDPFTVHDVTARLLGEEEHYAQELKAALPDHLADAFADKGKSFTRRLGKAFASIDRRRFDEHGLRVERAAKDAGANVQRWRIVSDGGKE